MLDDAVEAVVSCRASLMLELNPAERQVQLVVDHQGVLRSNLEESRRCGDRLAGQIHEGLGLEQHHPLLAQPHLSQPSLELSLFERRLPAAAKLLEDPKADVVPVVPVPTTGVAEAADQLHYFFLSSFFGGSSFLPTGAAAGAFASAAGAPGFAGAAAPGLASAAAGAAPSSTTATSAVGGGATTSSFSGTATTARV